MSWLVEVPEAERAAGKLSEPTLRAAHATLAENGVVTLRGAFPTQAVDALRSAFSDSYGAVDHEDMAARASKPPPNPILNVASNRYEVLLRLKGPFAEPGLLANAILMQILTPLLGQSMRLSGVTAVVSYPGAGTQNPHRDSDLLYDETGLAPQLPPYAINAAIPLVDVDIETGPTAFWLKSHRWGPTDALSKGGVAAIPFRRGDCILVDYRTVHAGMPNRSARVRPILYMVYARSWFFDDINHRERPSLDMDLEHFDKLPDPVKRLLDRAYCQRMRARYISENP